MFAQLLSPPTDVSAIMTQRPRSFGSAACTDDMKHSLALPPKPDLCTELFQLAIVYKIELHEKHAFVTSILVIFTAHALVTAFCVICACLKCQFIIIIFFLLIFCLGSIDPEG